MQAQHNKQRQIEQRRDAIIEAAVRVFLSQSVQGATMEEIAREAGVSKGALYLYFDSKDELFLCIALKTLGELQQKLDSLEHESFESGLERLRVGARLYARHALQHPGHFQVAMSWLSSSYEMDESTSTFAAYRAAISPKYEFLIAAIEQGKADGSIASEEPAPRIGIRLWGGMLGTVLVELNAEKIARRLPAPPPATGVCDAFIDSYLAVLKGAIAPSERLVSASNRNIRT